MTRPDDPPDSGTPAPDPVMPAEPTTPPGHRSSRDEMHDPQPPQPEQDPHDDPLTGRFTEIDGWLNPLVINAFTGEEISDQPGHDPGTDDSDPGSDPGGAPCGEPRDREVTRPGWADQLRSFCTVLAELLDLHPGLAKTLLELPTIPEMLAVASTRMTAHLTSTGRLNAHDAQAVVATAVRATIAATTGATAQLSDRGPGSGPGSGAGRGPAAGLPPVILDALLARYPNHPAQPGHSAQPGHPGADHTPTADGTVALSPRMRATLAGALVELLASLYLDEASVQNYTLHRVGGEPAYLSLTVRWPSEPR